MKKLISLLMTVMLVVCFSATLTVSADEPVANNLLLTHDFPGTGSDKDIDFSVWISKAGAGAAPRVDKNAASLYSETTTGVLWAWSDAQFAHNLTTPITDGKVLFSFDVNPGKLADTADTGDRTFEMYVGSTDYSVPSTKTSNFTDITKAAGIRLRSNLSSSINSRFEAGWGSSFSGADTVGVSEADWHHVDVLVDMDNKTLKTYLDYKSMKSVTNKITIESVNCLIFNSNLVANGVLLDNVRIIQNPQMLVTSVEVNEAKKYVDVAFNYDVTNELTAADITIANTNGKENVTVTSVARPSANVVRAVYENLNGGNYTISIGNVSSVAGSTSINESFTAALACIAEDFSNVTYNSTTGTINSWMSVVQPDNTTVSTDGGKLTVTTGSSHTAWEKVVYFDLITNTDFANIYKAIREGGVDGGTFKAGTTHVGKLSYEFDMTVNTSGGTVVMYDGYRRIFRVNTSQGFHAGTSEKVDNFATGTTYKVKVVFDFENQKVTYYLDGTSTMTTNFTDTIYNSGNKLIDSDMFKIYFGVYKDNTAVFDNFVIRYTADDCKVQNLKATKDGEAYTVTGEIVNPFNGALGSTVIFALYNGNEMVDVQMSAKPTAAYGQTALNETFTVPDGVTYTKYKVFVWDMKNQLKPLSATLGTE